MSEFLRNFLSHDAGPVAQFIKYALVGGLSSAIHIFSFFVFGRFLFPSLTQDDIVVKMLNRFHLCVLSEDYLLVAFERRARNAAICNVLAFTISNTVCYILNRIFVFTPGRHSMLTEITLFFAASGLSMLLGTVVQTLLIQRAKLQTTIAFGANLVASLLINYAMRRFVIFNG